MIEKPMLASDWDPEKVKLPAILQPKIDGVRGINPDGELVARSFKPFDNLFTTSYFGIQAFAGLDGEFAAEHQCNPRLCSLTTSALTTIEGQPFTLWWLFDYVVEATVKLPYLDRMIALHERVNYLKTVMPQAERLRVMPSNIVNTFEELLLAHQNYVAMGYEGSILRDPMGKYKNGRSTVREGGLLRIKDFADCEGVVTRLEEGETNTNEATVNPLGYTERSTHQANMISNGKVGALHVVLIEDVKVNLGKKIIPAGTAVKVGAGCMLHEDRQRYMATPEALVGQIVKFQHFPHGVKDKLRFPTFQSIRAKVDMS